MDPKSWDDASWQQQRQDLSARPCKSPARLAVIMKPRGLSLGEKVEVANSLFESVICFRQ